MMILRTFLSVACLLLVLAAQQVGLAQSSYSAAELDDSWHLIGEAAPESRAERYRNDRYRDSTWPASRGAIQGNDGSRTTSAQPCTVVTRLAQPQGYTTNSSVLYPVATARSSTLATTAAVNKFPPSYHVAPRAPPSVQYTAPSRYGSPRPTVTPPASSSPVTWARYDGARSYPVATVGYRQVPLASSNYYYGTSLYGQPVIYTKDQPIRNWLRSLLP